MLWISFVLGLIKNLFMHTRSLESTTEAYSSFLSFTDTTVHVILLTHARA